MTTSNAPDFSGVDAAPGVGLMDNVVTLVDRLRRLTAEVKAAELRLEELNAALNKLSMVDIPEAMQACSLSELKLLDGSVLKVTDGVNAYITQENAPAAYEWLRANGHAGVIKDELVIDYRGLDQEQREEIAQTLSANGVVAPHKESVHASTLKALMRDVLERGITPPPCFSIHQYKKAVIKDAKK